jgi:purine catabolism regulator
METVVEVVAAVVPFPLIIVDLAAGTFSVRRSPLPKLISERKWKRLIGEELAPAVADLVRSSAMGGGKTRGVLAVPHDAGAVTLHPVVEPLQVHNETLGGLIIFPSGEGLDDLDAMVAQAAKLALNVQFMRDHLRFRREANSLAEVFQTLFAGTPRHPSEVVARARRLNVSLPGPARLIAIGISNDGPEPGEPQSAGLHLTLARCAADLRPGAAVMVDDDLIVYAPVSPKEEPALWEQFTSGILAAVESHAGARPVAAVSRLCRRLSDYREARLECGRTLALARMFGKSGLVSQADFGPFAVLLSAVDQPSARDFVRLTLGAIEEHDARHGGELLDTLMEFVRDSCRYQACADRLGIHVSTLRYRVQRMQELFAINFDHPDSLFGLALALRLRALAGYSPRPGSVNGSKG